MAEQKLMPTRNEFTSDEDFAEDDDEQFSELDNNCPSSDAADEAAGPRANPGQQLEAPTSDSDAPQTTPRLNNEGQETLLGGSSSSDCPRQRKQPKQDRGPEEKWYTGNPPSWIQASWFQGFDGDLSGLWMALKAALNDAKDAQAEAVAAWKEVSEAREKESALSVQKKRKEKVPGSTLSGGERATAKGLRARNESLRTAVQDAKKRLQEERRQNQRVLVELQRLEQRAQLHFGDTEGLHSTVDAVESSTGYPGSTQKVLPGIAGLSLPAPGHSKPQTPREIGSARSNRKNPYTPRRAEGANSRPNTTGAAPLPKIAPMV